MSENTDKLNLGRDYADPDKHRQPDGKSELSVRIGSSNTPTDTDRLDWMQHNIAHVSLNIATWCKCLRCETWQVTLDGADEVIGEDEFSLRAAIDKAMLHSQTRRERRHNPMTRTINTNERKQ